ncbi:oxygenase MpaB family protein [Streptomyces sp. TRM 70361]|uniref:oxygenase MpaB family protein n=1 Tax=Streptomyces sp. TRM 70361 TaxID=3116553 RepID=UPI003FCDD45D
MVMPGGEAQTFKGRIDDVLRRFVTEEADRLLALDAELAPVAEQLRAVTAHGRRLRSAFCYWGWRTAGQPDSDALVRAATRMAETGQFTVHLMRPDAFEAGGRFVPAAQKVRLLHAAVRHHLKREGRWDVEGLGTPICQEDMIGGQMFFSLLVLDSLHRLGIHMSAEGAEAYYYAWRVVGAMLGADQGAAPEDLQAARRFLDLYLVRRMGPSEEGARLTRQLIDLYEEVVPGTFFDPIVSALIRYLTGDTCADWLDVPRTSWDTAVKAAPAVLGVLETLEDRSPLGAWALDRLGHLTTVFELSTLTRGRVMHYAIPEQLKKDYGVSTTVPRSRRWTPPAPTIAS